MTYMMHVDFENVLLIRIFFNKFELGDLRQNTHKFSYVA